jgi:putative transposase
VRNKYQRKERKSNHKFEVGGQELLVRVPLPIAEVWAEMQAQVEELTGQAGLQILRAILENEVTQRVGPPHRPNPTAGCVRWGKQPGYVVFAGQKIPLERPRVRTREGQEVELESYGQLQQDGKLQWCGSAWWPDCPRGTIGERWKVCWKAMGSRRAA